MIIYPVTRINKDAYWRWVGVIWLSYILSQGDHRKVTVREWVNQRRYTIEKVCGISLVETDFTDDRLTILLRKLSQESTWSQIERQLNTNTISIYDLSVEQIRLGMRILLSTKVRQIVVELYNSTEEGIRQK